jgi:hypothetical protein
MSDQHRPSDRERVVTALGQLVEALDRRVPHVERLGEAGIARDAAALRQEAAKRLAKLTSPHRDRDREAREDERAAAAMTDDGAPLSGK